MLVTGITAERAAEIEGNSVVSGTINAAGQLILTKANAEEIIAGTVSVNVPWETVSPDFLGSLVVGNGTLRCRRQVVNKTVNLQFVLVCGTTTTGPAATPLEIVPPNLLKDDVLFFPGYYSDASANKSSPVIWEGNQNYLKRYNPVTDAFEHILTDSLGQFDIINFEATYEIN